MKKILYFLCVIYFLSFGMTGIVYSACNVSVSPTEVQVNSSTTFTFLITNTGASAIQMVKIPTNMGEALSITGANSTGWDESSSGESRIFTTGSIAPGDYHLFDINSTVGNSTANINWVVETSESDSSQLGTCNTVSINVVSELTPTAAPILEEPEAPPTITGVSVSASSTTASLYWVLDKTATTIINYGTTNEYGSSTSTNDMTVSLSGLQPSTTYHYVVQATGAGGTTVTSDNIFITTAANATTTTITTPPTTVYTTSTTTKTVVLSDTISPTVQINTQLNKQYTQSPVIEGVVSDAGAVNSGILKIQYSVDGGKSWLLVDEPNGAIRTSFHFVPELSEDNNYSLIVRAIDKTGNIGKSKPITLIIDRLPPRIIHSLWHMGPIILRPNSESKLELIAEVPTHLVVQGIGGITKMVLNVGSAQVPLVKNKNTGYWEGVILLSKGGEWDAVITAIDGGGSSLEQIIAVVHVISAKPLISSAQVLVMKYNAVTKQYSKWNADPYLQANPHKAQANWFLPPGTYYFTISAPGYNSAVSKIVSFTQSRAVVLNPLLKKRTYWGLIGGVDEFEVEVSSSSRSVNKQLLLGKKLTFSRLQKWLGKEYSLTILPLWDPSTASSLLKLSNEATYSGAPHIVVCPGVTTSVVDMLQARGGYNLTFMADPDGEIMSEVPGVTLPLTFQVDRKGEVTEVLY